MSAVVAEVSLVEVHAWISCREHTVLLTWTDYGPNQWTEEFLDLHTALARLATLVYCADERNDHIMFAEDEVSFARKWERFAVGATS